MSEMDEIGQEMDRVLRVTRTAAGQIAEVAAHRNAAQARRAAAASREQTRVIEAELRAQRDAARLVHRQAGDPRWWHDAQPHDVAAVWQAARTWAGTDPQAAAAADLVHGVVSRKWGIILDDLPGASRPRSPREQADDLVHAVADRASAHAEMGETAHRPDAPGAVRPYARARGEEMTGAPAAAQAARLDAAQGFPLPTHAAIRNGGTTKAKARRVPGPTAGRDHDLGR
jgi:hypothetical protein